MKHFKDSLWLAVAAVVLLPAVVSLIAGILPGLVAVAIIASIVERIVARSSSR